MGKASSVEAEGRSPYANACERPSRPSCIRRPSPSSAAKAVAWTVSVLCLWEMSLRKADTVAPVVDGLKGTKDGLTKFKMASDGRVKGQV